MRHVAFISALLSGCASPAETAARPVLAPASAPPSSPPPVPALPTTGPRASPVPAEAPGPTAAAPNPKDVARAKKGMEKGIALYKRGDYNAAEEALKEAITIYPFLPEANLALGKILLIRGAALRDPALLASARLMFEMARALDPALRESEVLLQLFAPAPE